MRNHSQPLRRNSALHRLQEDLVLWLKKENNFDDSSYYEQKTAAFNPHPIDTSVNPINLPTFDFNEKSHGTCSALYNSALVSPFKETYKFNISGNYLTNHPTLPPSTGRAIVVRNGAIARTGESSTLYDGLPLADPKQGGSIGECLATDLVMNPHYDWGTKYTLEFLPDNTVDVYKKQDLTDVGKVANVSLPEHDSAKHPIGVGLDKPSDSSTNENTCFGTSFGRSVENFMLRSLMIAPDSKVVQNVDSLAGNVELLVKSTRDQYLSSSTDFKDSTTKNYTITNDATTEHDVTFDHATSPGCPSPTESNSPKYGVSSIKFNDSKLKTNAKINFNQEFTIDFWVNIKKTECPSQNLNDITFISYGSIGPSADHCAQQTSMPSRQKDRHALWIGTEDGFLKAVLRGYDPARDPKDLFGNRLIHNYLNNYNLLSDDDPDYGACPAFFETKFGTEVIYELWGNGYDTNGNVFSPSAQYGLAHAGGDGWHHVAFTVSKQGAYLHLDGTLIRSHGYVAQSTELFSIDGSQKTAAEHFYSRSNDGLIIGGDNTREGQFQSNRSTEAYFEGGMEDVRVTLGAARYDISDFTPSAQQAYLSSELNSEKATFAHILEFPSKIVFYDVVDDDSTGVKFENARSLDLSYIIDPNWILSPIHKDLEKTPTPWVPGTNMRTLYFDGENFYILVEREFGQIKYGVIILKLTADKVTLVGGGVHALYGSGGTDPSFHHSINRDAKQGSTRGLGANVISIAKDNVYVNELLSRPRIGQWYYNLATSRYKLVNEKLKYMGNAFPINTEQAGCEQLVGGINWEKDPIINATSHAVTEDQQHLIAFFSNRNCTGTSAESKGYFQVFKINDDGSLTAASEKIRPHVEAEILNTAGAHDHHNVIVHANGDKYRYYKNFYIKGGYLFCTIYPQVSMDGQYGLYENNTVTEIYKIDIDTNDISNTSLNIVYNPQKKMDGRQKVPEPPFHVNQVSDQYMWTEKRANAHLNQAQYNNGEYPFEYVITTLPQGNTYVPPDSPQSLMVSGSGVYSLAQAYDSAELLTFKDNQDFTIECWAKFNGIPNGTDDSPGAVLWDWGNVKFSNTSGFFSINDPDGNVTDYYDPDLIAPESNGKTILENKFIHYAVQRRNGEMEFWMDYYDERGRTIFTQVAEDTTARGTITGITGMPYNQCKAIGSTVTGSNFFTGWIDEVRVWREALYGPGPVIVAPRPVVKGIYYYKGRNFHKNVYMMQKNRAQPPAPNYADICSHKWTTYSIYVETVMDPRYSLTQPLPYTIEWSVTDAGIGGRATVIGEVGSTKRTPKKQELVIGNTIYILNESGQNELKIFTSDLNKHLQIMAKVWIGPPARPKYYYTTIAYNNGTNLNVPKPNGGNIRGHYTWYKDCTPIIPPPPPPPKAGVTMKCHNSSVTMGDDIEITATWWDRGKWYLCGSRNYGPPSCHRHTDPSVVLPPQPLKWVWTNKGRALQTDQCDPSVPWYSNPGGGSSQPCWPSSTLKWKNVRKSVKGPICAEVYDANNKLVAKACCPGFSVKMPPLQCPIVTNITPDSSTSKYNFTAGRGMRNARAWWTCFYYGGQITGKPNNPSIDVKFGFDLTNVNVAELNTGPMMVQWLVQGREKDGTLVNYNCPAIPSCWDPPTVLTDHTRTPTGFSIRWYTTDGQSGPTSKTISINEGFNGTVKASIYFDNYAPGRYWTTPGGNVELGKATLVTWSFGMPECEEPFGKALAVMGSTNSNFGGGWVVNRSGQWQRGGRRRTTTTSRTRSLSGGREDDFSGQKIFVSACNTIELPIQFIKNINNRGSESHLYAARGYGLTESYTVGGTSTGWTTKETINHPNGPYYMNIHTPDVLTLTKSNITSDDHGKYVEVTFNNGCGTRTIRYDINVDGGSSSPPMFRMSRISRYMDVNPNFCDGRVANCASVRIKVYYQERKLWNWVTGQTTSDFQYIPTYHSLNFTLTIPSTCYSCTIFEHSSGGGITQHGGWSDRYAFDDGFLSVYGNPRAWGSNQTTISGVIRTNNKNLKDQQYTLWCTSNPTDPNDPNTGTLYGSVILTFERVDLPVITSHRPGNHPWYWYCGGWTVTRQGQWNRGGCWWWGGNHWERRQTVFRAPMRGMRLHTGGHYVQPIIAIP